MEIFNDLIKKTYALLPENGRTYEYMSDCSACKGRENELILEREAAYELGGGNKPCVSYALFTEDESLVPEDEISVYGSDLTDIREDRSFARIALIRTDFIEENGDQGAYAIIESIALRKYDVFPKGYMVRTAALSNREQVRVAGSAIKAGLSFRDVGSIYISEYKKNKHVKAVKMIFITLPQVDYSALDRFGTRSTEIFRALNHIIADLNMDCRHCEWKPVCDEVEGMKEMHIKVRDTGKKSKKPL